MQETNTAIVSLRSVGPETYVAEIETPPAFDGYPGQFVRLSLRTDGEELDGYYTISSAYVREVFAVTFDAGPGSELGRELAARGTGAPVGVAGPRGDACYSGGHDVVVLAGGPGLGAGLGVCRRAVADGHDATLVYRGDRRANRSGLARLERTDATVAVVESESVSLAALVEETLGGASATGYVYGYSEFVTEATRAIRTADLDPDDVAVSSFG